jgi:dihydroorotate dehydrogenase
MYQQIRPFLFRLEPERAHNLTVALLRVSGALPPVAAALRTQFRPEERPASVRAFGLTFSNPVGLAAGYDKDGLAWRGLAALGFGHIEVGTVTVRPQGGNPGPRVFRIPESQAVINRMGFPNRGAEFVAHQLRGPRPKGLVLGVNIGKNKTTPLEEAAEDYTSLIHTFAPLADYLTVNISSPNTPGLRALQSGPALEALLRDIRIARLQASRKLGRNVPIIVKLAPDLTPDQLVEAVSEIRQSGMDGIILSNTTLRRDGLTSPLAEESGGMSGKPLRRQATEMLHRVMDLTGGRFPVVAAGGVMSAEDALEKLDAGATLVQVYTGLIYQGPGLVKSILEHPAFQGAGARTPSGIPGVAEPGGLPSRVEI